MLDFVKNVLIVDDREDEIKNLKSALEGMDIGTLWLKPDNVLTKDLKPKDLLFLDFMLRNDESEFKNIMSDTIRPLLEKHFNKKHPYGIVVWSTHENELDEFYEKICIDTFNEKRYDAPLFVVVLEKDKYLSKQDFSTIMSDLEQKLKDSAPASFFINWNNGLSKASYASISGIYGLAPDLKNQDEKIKNILYKLARSQTEISQKELDEYVANNRLTNDAYKTMDSLLCSNLKLSERLSYENLFSSFTPNSEAYLERIKIASHLNTKLFISDVEFRMNNVVPGNVYEILDCQSTIRLDNVPSDSRYIAIELSPPCDVVNKKKNNRLVGGLLLPTPVNENDYIKRFNGHYSQSKNRYCPGTYSNSYYYVLRAMHLPNEESTSFSMILDFRFTTSIPDMDLQDNSKYKLLFKTKNDLFADILQKFSSHGARLGLAEIRPD